MHALTVEATFCSCCVVVVTSMLFIHTMYVRGGDVCTVVLHGGVSMSHSPK